MKKISLLLLLIICSVLSWGQPDYLTKSKTGAKTYGIASKMTYEAIINTPVTKADLIEKTKLYLEQNLLSPVGLKLEEDEISDDRTNFVLKFGFRQGVYHGKAMMGFRTYKAPVKLFFDAHFAFNDLGQIKISFTNFYEHSFFQTLNGYYYLPDLSAGGKGLKEDPKKVKSWEEISDVYSASYAETSPLMKILIILNAGTDNLENQISKLNDLLNTQFDVYERAVSVGAGLWLKNPQELIDSYPPKGKSAKVFIPIIQERAEKECLIITDNERWDKYFQNLLTNVFIDIAELNDGIVDKVAKDGVEIFENINGTLKPKINKK